MTLKELYQEIGADYDQAIRTLRMEKLMDKHIRKFPANGAVKEMLSSGEELDAQRIFESAHAVKGIAGNLGLKQMYELSSELSEEFRPGTPRELTDAEVRTKLQEARELYRNIIEAISRYEAG